MKNSVKAGFAVLNYFTLKGYLKMGRIRVKKSKFNALRAACAHFALSEEEGWEVSEHKMYYHESVLVKILDAGLTLYERTNFRKIA